MKGLERIPSLEDLRKAYDRLLGDRFSVQETELARWTQWARFDPRLAEQLVLLLSRDWKAWNPSSLREALLAEPWPASLGVLAESVLAADLVGRPERARFRKWIELILNGVAPASGEQFFIGLRKIAGQEMLLDAEWSLLTYRKWGYLGREILVNKAREKARVSGRTLLSAPLRKRALQKMLKSGARLTVESYRKALDYQISRRQAELDLAREKRLVPVGKTRGRFYRVK